MLDDSHLVGISCFCLGRKERQKGLVCASAPVRVCRLDDLFTSSPIVSWSREREEFLLEEMTNTYRN